jgi:hypothetical protein
VAVQEDCIGSTVARDPIPHGLPGTLAFLWILKSSVAVFRILIVMYVPLCVLRLTVFFCVLFVCNCHRDIGALFDYPEGFPCFFLSLRQLAGNNSQTRGTARISRFFLFIVIYVSLSVFCVLFVCKCVLYYCHQVLSQLQLKINKFIN